LNFIFKFDKESLAHFSTHNARRSPVVLYLLHPPIQFIRILCSRIQWFIERSADFRRFFFDDTTLFPTPAHSNSINYIKQIVSKFLFKQKIVWYQKFQT